MSLYRTRNLCVLLCLLAAGGSAPAASPAKLGSATPAQLQAMVNEAAKASGLVGAQVSVILGDQRADFVYGSANVELNLPMTVDTIIQVGSVTKVFNAAMIMTLVEEKKLDLDTPVIEYIPDFKLADKQAQDTITLRQLLSMSSGMDNGPYAEHGWGEDGLERYVASLRDVPQIFPPGKGYGYSNAGTSVAGYVAQRVMGVRWDTLMQKRIFDPAGLTHAVTLAEDLPFYRVSAGHIPAKDGQPAKVIRPWYIMRAQGPAGSTLTTSAHDLAAFAQIFVNGGRAANGNQVLSEASVKTMMTPTTDVPMSSSFMNVGQKWGIGPSMDRWGDTVVWGHAGGNRSGQSRISWMPEKRGVLAVVLNNPGNVDAFTAKIYGDFSKAVFGVGPAMPVRPAAPVRLENLKRFVGRYERYGTQYEVSEESGQLRFKQISVGTGRTVSEDLGIVYDTMLIPLGGDRFLLDIPGRGKNPIPAAYAPVAFFGDDGQGRAANLVNVVMASRRVK